MCDFLGYEIKDMLPRKKFIEEEEPELRKGKNNPLRLANSPYNHYKPIISYISYPLEDK